MIAALLLAGILAQPLPDIASKLPPTWPPPGWKTSIQPAQPPTAPAAQPPAEQDKWVEVLPHVRLNRAQKAVEFDGVVAWDFHNPDTPRTELELLVCLPMRDKEHESLLLSKAKGADVHAALLMVGLEPGKPGRIDFGDDKQPGFTRVAPVGPTVIVRFRYLKDGVETVVDPAAWVIDEVWSRETEQRKQELKERDARLGRRTDRDPILFFAPLNLVFGGSSVGQKRNEQGEKINVYNADELGCLIGLCTFGAETIGNAQVTSPDSGVDAPRYVARNDAIPPTDTPVRVRISVPGVEEEMSFPGLNDSLRAR